MKSAYGFKIPESDPELTPVGPGTPCGELMRGYWQPVCLQRWKRDSRLFSEMIRCLLAIAGK